MLVRPTPETALLDTWREYIPFEKTIRIPPGMWRLSSTMIAERGGDPGDGDPVFQVGQVLPGGGMLQRCYEWGGFTSTLHSVPEDCRPSGVCLSHFPLTSPLSLGSRQNKERTKINREKDPPQGLPFPGVLHPERQIPLYGRKDLPLWYGTNKDSRPSGDPLSGCGGLGGLSPLGCNRGRVETYRGGLGDYGLGLPPGYLLEYSGKLVRIGNIW